MKMKLYFYHEQWNFEAEGKVVAWSLKLEEELTGARLRIFLGEREVEVPNIELLPEAQLKQIMVTGLRQEAKDLQAETHMKLKAIDEKIQQLLCLENKSDGMCEGRR